MQKENIFDVIIVGGSYAGLSAAMSLGRSSRRVLIIDSGKPCNQQTPHSHNFLTRDGETPANLAAIAKAQVLAYPTVKMINAFAESAAKTNLGFEVSTADHQKFLSKKLVLATGVKDIFPNIIGFAKCWGISVLHCPYCHGYEVKGKKLGVIANGEIGFEFSKLIYNLSKDLTIFTNGAIEIDQASQQKLASKNINIVEKGIDELFHENGLVNTIKFKDGSTQPIEAIFARVGMEQNTKIITDLGVKLTDLGYVEVDFMKKTNVTGVFAAGDCTTMFRAVAEAVAAGNIAGAIVNKELVADEF
ncbi:NAD(P)/FAD-dependent oxidoreductase [Pedobacter cryotolerans]|uniref:NAD(P)/FAD-dependent oxidoreductase n=1 Tax=Pedobacter cryotolerans TaxID=2571270 RepID=A0A4U1C7L2_9SPHI|nr:NAD(P)/FAD-dependent oxidoreductase [Pedobacter cryotolerans]TKC02116.1 NAD(P)/FAD-dependent oxidoreductase [Pedobacter cryotolerans]